MRAILTLLRILACLPYDLARSRMADVSEQGMADCWLDRHHINRAVVVPFRRAA